ncbi:MAG: hypothetical protein P4L10_14780 [Acidobacteriaceae bacterium]|nr:hypothetical protein [Acidobacteriaceae bacterium]
MVRISILLGLLCALVGAYPYVNSEKKSLLYLPRTNFALLGSLLQEIYNATGQQVSIKYSDGAKSVDMVIAAFEKLKPLVKVAKDMQIVDGTIVYHIPSAFRFDLDVDYVLTYLFVPLAGTATLRLTAEDVTYKLAVTPNSIVPSFSGKWKLELTGVSNGLAILFGAKDMLAAAQSALAAHFDAAVNLILANEVKRFYEDFFGSMNYYIHFPHLRNASITLAHTFKSFALNKVGALEVAYEQHFDPIPKSEVESEVKQEAEDGYLRSVRMNLESIARILQWEVYLTQNAVLTDNMIPADSYFRADLRSLARVFPDLLQQLNNVPVSLTFNGIPADLTYVYNKASNTIHVLGMTFNVTVAAASTGTLMSSVFSVDATFKPFFTADPADTQRVLMNLQTISTNVYAVSSKSHVSNPVLMFNQQGVADYLQSALDNFFVQYHRSEVLGTGILLSFEWPVAHDNIRYSSEADNELTVYLFPADS